LILAAADSTIEQSVFLHTSQLTPSERSSYSVGTAQPDIPNWNASGFMRNVVEATPFVVVA
jgi:hypothetical protein